MDDRSLATVDSWMIAISVSSSCSGCIIDVLDLEEKHTAWGLVQVVVEVTWLTWLATYLTKRWTDREGLGRRPGGVRGLGDAWTS